MDTLLRILFFPVALRSEGGHEQRVRRSGDDNIAMALNERPGVLVAPQREAGEGFEGGSQLREVRVFGVEGFFFGRSWCGGGGFGVEDFVFGGFGFRSGIYLCVFDGSWFGWGGNVLREDS